MKIEQSVTNKNFGVALKIVQRDFPHLFHESLSLIKLCKASEHVWSCNLGVHKRLVSKFKEINENSFEYHKEGLKISQIFICNGSHHKRLGRIASINGKIESQIFICNGYHAITQFINTLVHELTHLQQHIRIEAGESLTREQMEDEAYSAGRKAAEKYEGKM